MMILKIKTRQAIKNRLEMVLKFPVIEGVTCYQRTDNEFYNLHHRFYSGRHFWILNERISKNTNNISNTIISKKFFLFSRGAS